MELYQRYKKEISEDLKIDAFNLKDASMLVPSKKHFWVSRLNDHRLELSDLKMKKAKILKSLIQKAEASSPVKLSKANLEKTLETIPEIQDLDEQIRINEHLVQYLQDEIWIFSKLTEDKKNMIENIKLEQM